MKNTLIIIGTHKPTRVLFDWKRSDIDDCAVWLFNEALSRTEDRDWAKRADAVFQMHLPVIWRNPRNRNDPHHYEWLKTQDECDVYMTDVYPDVPRSVKYPLDDVLAMLGEDADHFLTSSAAEALALGILQGYRKIEVYGVAMESNTEYQFQRDGIAFWYGFARGRGIDFRFINDTFKSPVYGFEGSIEIPYKHFEDREAELAPKLDELSEKYKSALIVVKRAVDTLELDASVKNENAVYDAIEAQRVCAEDLGVIDGALQEIRRYKGKADTMISASGSFLFSRQEFESMVASSKDKIAEKTSMIVAYGTKLEIAQKSMIGSGGRKRKQYGEAFRSVLVEYLKASNACAVMKGVQDENARLMVMLDRSVRAAGGERAEQVLREATNVTESIAVEA